MPKKKPNAAPDDRSKAVSKARPKKAKAPATSASVYQLKITLNDIRPPIWRRVQAKDCTLATLHDVIQAAMGWEDYHLHLCEVVKEHYGDPEQFRGDLDVLDEGDLTLSQLAARRVKKLTYEYDMGDGWRHTIALEKPVPAEAGVKYPRCVAGERACPPEDCGGPWGYGDLLDALENPRTERHEELLEWIGDGFDPEAFDLEAVNEGLQGAG